MCQHCRQTLEESTAVLCPSVAYQLAGAKKVQQDLASPETLERYLDSREDIELARSCFAGQRVVTDANFLLKGQRLVTIISVLVNLIERTP